MVYDNEVNTCLNLTHYRVNGRSNGAVIRVVHCKHPSCCIESDLCLWDASIGRLNNSRLSIVHRTEWFSLYSAAAL